MENISTEHATVENLNIALDETTIYENGKLITLKIEELLDNETALKQLINAYNVAVRTNETNKKVIERLKLEKAGYKLQPYFMFFLAFVNIIGVIFVGIGTNMITSSTPSLFGGWILGGGALLSLLSAISSIILPIIIPKLDRGA